MWGGPAPVAPAGDPAWAAPAPGCGADVAASGPCDDREALSGWLDGGDDFDSAESRSRWRACDEEGAATELGCPDDRAPCCLEARPAGARPLLLGVDARGRISLWDAPGGGRPPPPEPARPLWQLELAGQRSSKAKGPWEGARVLSWAPGGHCFAAVGSQDSKAVYLWRVYDAQDGCKVAGLYCGRDGAGARGAAEQDGVCIPGPPHEGIKCTWRGAARSVSFCAGGRCLAVAEDVPSGQQPALAVFDVQTRSERHRVVVPEEIWGLSYIPQSWRLVVSTTARVMLWPIGRPRGEAAGAGLRHGVGSRLWPRWGAREATGDEPWEVDVEYRKEFKVRAWEDIALDSELHVTGVLPLGPAAGHGVEGGKRWLLKGYRESAVASGYVPLSKSDRSPALPDDAPSTDLLRKLPVHVSLIFQRPLGDDVIAEARGHRVHCTAVSPDGTRVAVATAATGARLGDHDQMQIAVWSVEGLVPWKVEKDFLLGLKGGCLLKTNGSHWALAWADLDTLLVSSEAAESLTAVSVSSGEIEQQWALQPGTRVRAIASVPPAAPAERQARMAIAKEQPGGARIELSASWAGAPGEALVQTDFATEHKTLQLLAACTPCGCSVALAGRSQRPPGQGPKLTDGEVRVLRFAALGAMTQRSVWIHGASEGQARRKLNHIGIDGPVLALLFAAGGGARDEPGTDHGSAVEVWLEGEPKVWRRWDGIPERLDAVAVHYWPTVAGGSARSAEAAIAVGAMDKDQRCARMVRLSLQGKGKVQEDWSHWEDLKLSAPSGESPATGDGDCGAMDLRFSPYCKVQAREGSAQYTLPPKVRERHALLAGMIALGSRAPSMVQVWEVDPGRKGGGVSSSLSPLGGHTHDEIWCVDTCWWAANDDPRQLRPRVAYYNKKGGLEAVDMLGEDKGGKWSNPFKFQHDKTATGLGAGGKDGSKVTALRFSPCGSVLAAGGKNGAVRLYLWSESAKTWTSQACQDLDLCVDVRVLASPGVQRVQRAAASEFEDRLPLPAAQVGTLRGKKSEFEDRLLMPSRVVSIKPKSRNFVVDDLRCLSSRVYAKGVDSQLSGAGGGAAEQGDMFTSAETALWRGQGDLHEWLRASPSLVHQRLLRRHLSWTLLHVYAHSGQIQLVQKTLKLGAHFLALDARGRSALDVALDMQHFKVVEKILKYVLEEDPTAVRRALPSEHEALCGTVVRLLESHRMIDDSLLVRFLEECCCQKPLTPAGSHGVIPESAPLFHDENICSFAAPLFVPGAAQMGRLLSEDANSRWSLPGRAPRPRPVEVKVWYLRGLDRQVGLTRALAHTRKSPEILRSSFATAVLKHKWAMFAKGKFRVEIRQYFLILMFFVFFCESGNGASWLCSDAFCSSDAFANLVLWVCTFGIFALCVHSIYGEYVELCREAALWRKDHGRLSARSVPSILKNYLNVWNVFDFTRIFCTLLCAVCSILGKEYLFDTISGRALLAFTAIVSWSRMVSFFRGFSYTSDLVLTVVRIIKEVLVVLSLLLVVLLAFTHAMYIFFSLDGVEGFRLALEYVYIGGIIGDPPDQPESFTNCEDTANGAVGLDNPHTDAPIDCEWYSEHPSWCDRASLEYYDDSDFTVSDMCCDCGGGLEGDQYLPLFLYILLSVIMLVILMNFIIAFMGDSFNRAREDLAAAKNEMRAELVYEYEGDLTEGDALASSYIFICRRVKPEQGEQTVPGRITQLESSVQEVKASLEDLGTKMDKVLAALKESRAATATPRTNPSSPAGGPAASPN